MVKKEEQPYHEDDDEGKIFWEQTTTTTTKHKSKISFVYREPLLITACSFSSSQNLFQSSYRSWHQWSRYPEISWKKLQEQETWVKSNSRKFDHFCKILCKLYQTYYFMIKFVCSSDYFNLS